MFLCSLALQVLITIYWLGRQAFYDSFYDGPNLNLKSFEGLLGTALSKVNKTKISAHLSKQITFMFSRFRAEEDLSKITKYQYLAS